MRVASQMPQNLFSCGETILFLQYVFVVTSIAIRIFHYFNTPTGSQQSTEKTTTPYYLSILSKIAFIGYISDPLSTLLFSVLASLETTMLFERYFTSQKYA
jgi:hypothetical protein